MSIATRMLAITKARAPRAPLPAAHSLSLDPTGLLAYQVPHVHNLLAALNSFGTALDASDTGTGKTYCAMACARHLGLRLAVVCPKSLIVGWTRAAQSFGVGTIFVQNYEQVKRGNVPECAIDGTGKFHWLLPEDTLLVFDEIHRCNGRGLTGSKESRGSQNARLVVAAKHYKVKTLGLSATCGKDPLDAWATGYLLGLHKLVDFWKWVEKEFGYNRFMAAQAGAYTFSAEKVKKLSRMIFPDHGSRIRIADLGDAFPETQITAESYPVENPEKIDAEFAAAIALLREQEVTALDPLVMTLRARQVAEAEKVPVLVELAEDYRAQGMSVVIFVNFTLSREMLAATLGTRCMVHGQQTGEERAAAIDAFQNGQERYIICNISAGGVGVNLHDLDGRFPRAALLCPGFSAVDLKQALGRVWRAGGKSKSIQRIIFAADTIEEKVCKIVKAKLRNMDLLNDADLAPEGIFKK